MTIVAFKKLTLFCPATVDKESILTALQALGCLHLISINSKKIESLTSLSTTLFDQIKKSLLILKNSAEKANIKKIDEKFDADEIVNAILTNEKQLRDVMDRHDFLQQRIKNLLPWGNFTFPDKEEMRNILFWFYKIKYKDISLLPNSYPIQEVYRDNQYIYLVVLADSEPSPAIFPSPRIHTGAISLQQLKQEFQEVLQRIDDLKEERRYLTRYQFLLNNKLASFADRTQLQNAHQHIRDLNDFYLIQGWVPESEINKVREFSSKLHLATTIEPVSSTEQAPTLLQTYPWTHGGIEIVNFYQLPGYHALDPSLMVFFSFSVFFAMILADAGYGFVIAFFTLLAWRRLGQSKTYQWVRPLLVTLSIFSIIYGVMVGSYFGYEPSAKSVLHQLTVFHINDFKTMMKVAIFVGCIHVIVANAMRGWFATHLATRLESIGFICLIIGVMILSYALIQGSHPLKLIAFMLIFASFLDIAAFASDIPVTSFKSFLKRMFKGLLSLSEIVALFSDILSYLRLFALGLAGASLAITINHIAANLHSSSAYGWIFAMIVFLLGQTLNFALCIMSAVIHGLRLNYIEFYKWSIKQEGYSYMPLRKTEVSHE